MLEKKAETEEGTMMMESTGAESKMKRRGKAVVIERGTGEEIETGIMGEIGTEIDTDIKNSSRSAFRCFDFHDVFPFWQRISIVLN